MSALLQWLRKKWKNGVRRSHLRRWVEPYYIPKTFPRAGLSIAPNLVVLHQTVCTSLYYYYYRYFQFRFSSRLCRVPRGLLRRLLTQGFHGPDCLSCRPTNSVKVLMCAYGRGEKRPLGSWPFWLRCSKFDHFVLSRGPPAQKLHPNPFATFSTYAADRIADSKCRKTPPSLE